MAAPETRLEWLEKAIEFVNDALREGFSPPDVPGAQQAVREGGRRMVAAGICKNPDTIYQWLPRAKARFGLEPDWSLYRPRQYQHAPPGAPAIPSQSHLEEPEPEGDPMRVLVIGDAHDSPHLPDKSRFRWLGAYCEEHGIERIVSIGDWWTMDCFSSHTDRATFMGRAKPTFDQDRDSFHESQGAFQNGLAGHKPKKHITLGNHEFRAWTWDNLHPESTSHSLAVQEAFAQWGWRTREYGEWLFLGGVGFTHVPLNGRSKPLAQGQRANKAMCDTIHGDDHRFLTLTDTKSGPFRTPTVYSAGTALPPGFIEGFANKGAGTWRSGVCEAILWGGYVRSWSFTEMVLLRKRYGRAGEALAA